MMKVDQHDDHEVIGVPNSLKRKIVTTGMGPIDTSVISRAEAALEELSVSFDDWLEEEISDLADARDDVHRTGLVPPAFDKLYRVAHDIKGEGETLGYPLATVIAGSLCKLLETPGNKTVIPLAILDNHVDALCRVLRDRIKDRNNATAEAVAERLLEVVAEFAAAEEASDT